MPAGEVNLYSSRQENLIRPVLDMFTEQTGITVNLVSGADDAIIERLRIEGRNSPADLLLTADAARLYRAKAADLLQPVQSEILEAAIPEAYRDPDRHWFGLSLRARVLMYAPDRVAARGADFLRKPHRREVAPETVHPFIRQRVQPVPDRGDDCASWR
jgi:iron(III) transport system substrate-binding protein